MKNYIIVLIISLFVFLAPLKTHSAQASPIKYEDNTWSNTMNFDDTGDENGGFETVQLDSPYLIILPGEESSEFTVSVLIDPVQF